MLPVLELIFLSFLVLMLVIWWYVSYCFNFWHRNGVPSTAPKTIFGDIRKALFGFINVSFVYDAIYKKFPSEKFVGIYDFLTPNLLIRDPDLIHGVLAKDFSHFEHRFAPAKHISKLDYHLFVMNGNEWKKIRHQLLPAFSSHKLKNMLPVIDKSARIFDSLLREKAEKRETFDAKELGARFAIDVIGSCMFGLDFGTLDNPHSKFRTIGKLLLAPNIRIPLLQLLRFYAPIFLQIFKISENPPEMEPFFVELLERNEELRRGESQERNDLMEVMLRIRNGEPLVADADPSFNYNVVLSNMFIFYAAGFETTSSTISYCLFELALNQQIQRRLREEIRSTTNSTNGELKYETLKKMSFMDMILKETLRKYSPAPFLNRVCTKLYQLPGSSMILKPGMRITIPVYSVHNDEKYYPNPDTFDPERFSPQNIKARPSSTYLPFGEGPRKCLAARFDMLEIKLCLVRLLSKYKFSTCEITENPVQTEPRSFLKVPKNGIQLRVEMLDMLDGIS